jgi:hypothetical protein
MDEHQCDKGPLIERLGDVLTRVDERTNHMAAELAKIKTILLGNGTLGLATHVENHASKIGAMEANMLTHDVARKLLWRLGGVLVGSVGLTATIVTLIDRISKGAP